MDNTGPLVKSVNRSQSPPRQQSAETASIIPAAARGSPFLRHKVFVPTFPFVLCPRQFVLIWMSSMRSPLCTSISNTLPTPGA
jgi:hypothetical protein